MARRGKENMEQPNDYFESLKTSMDELHETMRHIIRRGVVIKDFFLLSQWILFICREHFGLLQKQSDNKQVSVIVTDLT